MATVRTHAVRNGVIGEARKILEEAAGSNGVVSRTEASRLPRDIAQAVAAARETTTRVTVDDAVDAYARKVSRVLSAVDTRSRGTLSATEANKISEPTLRARVLDVRTALMSGGAVPTGGASRVFDRFKELASGPLYSSGGGVEAHLKPFMSGSTVRGAVSDEKLRELLATQWDTLKSGIWGDGSDLDNFQPGLGDLDALHLYRAPTAELNEELDWLAGPDGPPGFEALVRYMRANLTDLFRVQLMELDDNGQPIDLGHSAKFFGGKTADNRVVGFFTGQFVE